MTLAVIQFTADSRSNNDAERLLRAGQLLRVCGSINRRWDDDSALRMAEDLNLHDVNWRIDEDDTTGSLEFTLLFPRQSPAAVWAMIEEKQDVECCELNGEDYG